MGQYTVPILIHNSHVIEGPGACLWALMFLICLCTNCNPWLISTVWGLYVYACVYVCVDTCCVVYVNYEFAVDPT